MKSLKLLPVIFVAALLVGTFAKADPVGFYEFPMSKVTVEITATAPTERTDGTAITPEEIKEYTLLDEGEMIATNPTPSFTTELKLGETSYEMTVTDTNDLVSEKSHSVVVTGKLQALLAPAEITVQ